MRLQSLLLTLALLALPASANDHFYLSGGGWAYEARGTISNGGRPLDFEDDLNLKTTNKKEFGLGYRPEKLGWLPGVDANYVRIAERGSQQIANSVLFGVLTIPDGGTIENISEINDFEASFRYPFQLGPVRLSAGITAAYLDGDVRVTNPDTGEEASQEISQAFPLVSVGLEYQPLANLRLSTRADYIEDGDNKAQTLEAAVFWKMLGPVGLEAGWRQRRFKIRDQGNNGVYDARLSGARLALRFEFP